MKRADLCIKKKYSGRCSYAWEHWKGFTNLLCAVITWKLRLTILLSECSLIRRANIFLRLFSSFSFLFNVSFKVNLLVPYKCSIRSQGWHSFPWRHSLNSMLKRSPPYTKSWGCRSLPELRKLISGICLPLVPELLALCHSVNWEEISWITLWVCQALPCPPPWEKAEQHLRKHPQDGCVQCWWGSHGISGATGPLCHG